MSAPLCVLLVEDEEDDALLLTHHLRADGLSLACERVHDAEAMRAALDRARWDVVLCDYNLPGFGPLAARTLLIERGLDLPFIVVSGKMTEDDLVGLMKAGVHDIVQKDRLARLGAAVRRELAQAAARRRKDYVEQLLHEAIDNIDQGLAVFDRDDRLVLCNDRYRGLFSPVSDLIGPGVSFERIVREGASRGVLRLGGGEADGAVRGKARSAVEAPRGRDIELSDGRWLRLTERRMANGHLVAVVADDTERRRAAAQIERMAREDALTSLANRRQFMHELEGAISLAQRTGRLVGVMLLDLDGFKEINDTFGHQIGDALLKAVARRLRTCVRASDLVARLGGDEFAVIATSNEHVEGYAALARRITSRLARPFPIGGRSIAVAASVGITVYPWDVQDAEGLLRNADIALYRAKAQGPGSFRLYDEAMDREVRDRQSLEGDLRRALARGELVLYYQPQIDIRTGAVVGVEALLRWCHPRRGMMAPGEFIPVAERSRLMVEIDDWVVRAALGQARAWQHDGLAPPSMSINVSLMQFRQPGWIDATVSALRTAGVEPERLELEITERIAMFDGRALSTALDRVRAAGMRISIDDFGTGYSSLAQLRRVPFDKLKIDRSFVHNLDGSWQDAAVCFAIIQLGHCLNAQVVAEGIETEAELAILAEQGCDFAQGFYFAPPMAAHQAAPLLQQAAPPLPLPVLSASTAASIR